jgi:SET domain
VCICHRTKTACKHQWCCWWKFEQPFLTTALGHLYRLFHNKDLGFGLKTSQAIAKGGYIIEYVGECMYSEEEVLDILKKPRPHYVMDLGTHWVNGDERNGNLSRYINHSCNPNTEIVLWDCDGINRAFIVAKHYIPPNSWLWLDYRSFYHKERDYIPKVPCKCSADCTGHI